MSSTTDVSAAMLLLILLLSLLLQLLLLGLLVTEGACKKQSGSNARGRIERRKEDALFSGTYIIIGLRPPVQ